jgi:hypothetical protein
MNNSSLLRIRIEKDSGSRSPWKTRRNYFKYVHCQRPINFGPSCKIKSTNRNEETCAGRQLSSLWKGDKYSYAQTNQLYSAPSITNEAKCSNFSYQILCLNFMDHFHAAIICIFFAMHGGKENKIKSGTIK